MKLLLDTHILIWMLMNAPELTIKARSLVENHDNRLYYSTISVWEVAIKHRLHPQKIPCSGMKFISLCEASDMVPLSLRNEHIVTFERLHRQKSAPSHKDPFDQILISQAIAESMVFLTHDKTLKYYDEADVEIV